jgi:hypothetical protein
MNLIWIEAIPTSLKGPKDLLITLALYNQFYIILNTKYILLSIQALVLGVHIVVFKKKNDFDNNHGSQIFEKTKYMSSFGKYLPNN